MFSGNHTHLWTNSRRAGNGVCRNRKVKIMNEWKLYCAECAECVYYDTKTQFCGRNPNRTESGVCQRFTLTIEAEARRYVSAKTYADKIGIGYDENGFILRGKTKPVRVMVKKLMKEGK